MDSEDAESSRSVRLVRVRVVKEDCFGVIEFASNGLFGLSWQVIEPSNTDDC